MRESDAVGEGDAEAEGEGVGECAAGVAVAPPAEGVGGGDAVLDAARFERTDNGVVLIAQTMLDALNAA